MTTDFSKRGTDEAKTHELLDPANLDKHIEWSPRRQMAATVFRVMWSSSLTVQHIEKIAIAVCSLDPESCQPGFLQETLTALVRAKVPRSRMSEGKRHYEVNY